ncbi:hypothetical protein L1987_31295 [Smallanthus sonchifolius]|uniref:Uncharacterized protein n=1 Tax=Smallanthus sonchifolius TaxID=185202 RepID=A0ACB9I6K3_9ASTR|nr:hypothetical protein L1987_31295 [Smallanthus sonchifolius]
MLKHEDTFRHQVRELHRLYNVQKNLMSTLRSEAALNINNDDLGLISGFDLSRLIEEDLSCGDSSGIHDGNMCSNDVELTLSIGPSTSKRRSQNHDDSKATIRTSLGNSSTLYNQETKRPHWLFQDLSLDRT